jgi:hypothetical protein
MGDPGFWDDQANAARVSAEHSSANGRLTGFRALTEEIDSTAEMAGALLLAPWRRRASSQASTTPATPW